jgi:hypothetical protein
MLTDTQAREAFHVLVLWRLRDKLRPGSFALKGGVNLRLFFGSPRYSEVMDLDSDAVNGFTLRSMLSEIVRSSWLDARLRALGLLGVEYSGRPAKNTDTTFRMKVMVLNSGGIRLHTKIEVSMRGRPAADRVAEDSFDGAIVRAYAVEDAGPLTVPHYPADSATRQKLAALAGRATPEARDVFDLGVLAREDLANIDMPYLRRWLSADSLKLARERVWAFDYPVFLDQVAEFLGESDRARFGTRDAWETRQLFVSEMIDAVLALPQPAPPEATAP